MKFETMKQNIADDAPMKDYAVSKLVSDQEYSEIPAIGRKFVETAQNAKLYYNAFSDDNVIDELLNQIKGGSICNILDTGKIMRKFKE